MSTIKFGIEKSLYVSTLKLKNQLRKLALQAEKTEISQYFPASLAWKTAERGATRASSERRRSASIFKILLADAAAERESARAASILPAAAAE